MVTQQQARIHQAEEMAGLQLPAGVVLADAQQTD